MTNMLCPRCHGRKNLVVKINGKRQIIICDRCNGTGEVPIEKDKK